jgi:hypothetical protein
VDAIDASRGNTEGSHLAYHLALVIFILQVALSHTGENPALEKAEPLDNNMAPKEPIDERSLVFMRILISDKSSVIHCNLFRIMDRTRLYYSYVETLVSHKFG